MAGPKRLTRYVLSELAGATFLGIAVWTIFLLLNDLFFVARQAIQKDLGLAIVFEILALKVPSVLALSVPIGTLFGSLIAIGRLSADNELVALQAVGLGPRQLARTMAFHGLVLGAVGLSLYAFIIPWTMYELRSMQGRFLNVRNISTELKPRVFYDRLPGYVLFVDEIPSGTQGLLQRTLVYQLGSTTHGYEQLIVAREATLEPAPGGPGRLRIVFRKGVQNLFRVDDPDSYRSTQFETFWSPPIIPPAWMLPTGAPLQKIVGEMTPGELRSEMRDAANDTDKLLKPYRVRAVHGELNKRLALPCASLLFALLALPLGITRVRSGKGAGFAWSFLVVLVYWLVYVTATQQATEGRIPMVLGFWMANAVIAVWAAVAYASLRRGSGPGVLARLREWTRRLVDRVRKKESLPEPSTITPAPVVASSRRPWRLGSVLDRYVAVLYLRMLGLALAATYLVFSLIELKGILDAVVEKNHPVGMIFTYFKYFLPGALVLTLPFAAMIAAVVAITLLSRSGEITALKAAGLSARRVCVPIVVVTVLGCGAVFLVQDRIAPDSNRRAQAEKDRILGRNPRSYGVTPGGRWVFGSEGRLYHYRAFDPQRVRFQGLSVFRVDLARARILEQWFCSSAIWTESGWEVDRGWNRRFPEPGAAGEYRSFEKETLGVFDPPENFTRRERTTIAGNDLAEQVSIEELRAQIDELARSGYDTTRLRVQFWQKTATAVTPFITVLLGLPFAFKVGRRGSMYGVGVGLVLAIVFYAAAAVLNALGLEAIVSPFVAAWSPNLFFGCLGLYLFLFIPT